MANDQRNNRIYFLVAWCVYMSIVLSFALYMAVERGERIKELEEENKFFVEFIKGGG